MTQLRNVALDDLGPFSFGRKISTPVTSALENVHTIFAPFYFQLKGSYVTDGRTDKTCNADGLLGRPHTSGVSGYTHQKS